MLLAAPAALAAKSETNDLGDAPRTPAPTYSPNRVIVEWAAGADRSDRVSAREDANVTSLRQLGDPAFQLVRVDSEQSTADALAALRRDPDVQAASRDGYSAPNAIPNDPLFGELWGLENTGLGIDGSSGAVAGADIDVAGAWIRTVGTPSTVIADLDSGYRFGDPELGSVAWTNAEEAAGTEGVDDDDNGFTDDVNGYDFVGANADSPTSDKDPTDDNLISGGHGVHTAGTMGAAGNNEVGITGVAQDVRIMALRVCANSTAAGNEARCPFSSQIAAINYAGNMGARAANMSLGGTSFNAVVRDAIANHPTTLYVISAGNDGEDNDSEPHYPCNYNPLAEGKSAVDNVICVAATDQADDLADFSDWGATSVDLGAPGTETLSTYPGFEATFHDNFETETFATTWSQSGTKGFGRANPGDGPLTSFGMSDSPGQAPEPNTQYDTTLTTGVTVPAGSGACTLSGRRYRNGGSGGTFYYQVLSDGSNAFFNSGSAPTGGSAMVSFNTAPITGLGGHSVKLRFGYTSGSSPTSANGIWFDDLDITCYKPVSAPLGYEFLQGTSMAAPHVTGAAGLLFSLNPSATVTGVRNALLSTVDPVPSLAGKTVTGGRLNISQALDAFDEDPPLAPQLTETVPASPASQSNPKIVGSAEEGATIKIFLGGTCAGGPVATGTAAQLSSPGIGVSVPTGSTREFSATATDTALNPSLCSTPISYTNSGTSEGGGGPGPVEPTPPVAPPPIPPEPTDPVVSCIVPKLAGKNLSKAKAALAAAHCTLGKVKRPKAKRGHKLGALVVKFSTPGAGAALAGGKVDLKLGPKPKPKRPHH